MSRRKDTRAHLIYTHHMLSQSESRPPCRFCACAFPRGLHMFLDTALSLATLLEYGWLCVVRDPRRPGREPPVLTHTQAFGPHDTDSTFLGHAPRSEHVYGRARVACLRSDAALRALGDDRDRTEEQLAPLACVNGDAADRAVVDGRRRRRRRRQGHGRSLEKVPGKLGRVERGVPEVVVVRNRRRWKWLPGVKRVVAGSWHL